MAKQEKVTRDEHYDLVSVLYHSLQGDETLDQYIEDAEAAEPMTSSSNTFDMFNKPIGKSPSKRKSF
jgi:hypothetical protein